MSSSAARFTLIQLIAASVLSAVVGGLVVRVTSKSQGTAPEKVGADIAPIVSALEQAGKSARAISLGGECARQEPCTCVRTALTAALDEELQDVVLQGSEALFAQCEPGELDGLRAEGLARARSVEDATTLARARLQKEAKDPYALYALAHAFYVAGDSAQASQLVHQAIAARRGETAHLLAGLIAYSVRDFPEATRQFRKMLELNPASVAGHYNLGVAALAQNQYRDARESFLAALRYNPKHKEARQNLAIVTHSRGAQDEAKHHLAEYAKLVEPSDPQLAQLRARLSRPVAPVAPAASAAPSAVPVAGAGAGPR